MAAAIATVASITVSSAYVLRRPDLSVGAAFLFGDEGSNLFVADRLHGGAALYQSVAYPYGPVPIHLYAWVGTLVGNTPLAYLALMAILSGVTCGMAAWLIRSFAGTGTTFAAIAVGLLPTMPLPGAFIGGYTSSIYMPIERAILLGAVLAWQAPTERTRRRSFAIGGLLGACQAVRFGSGPVLLAALMILDGLSARFEVLGGRRRWLQRTMWLLGGLCAVEGALIVAGCVTQPGRYASEWLWPLQLLETHRTSGAPRWPTWAGWQPVLTQYLMPCLAAVFGLAAFVRWGTGRNESARHANHEAAALALLLCYTIAALVYFRHEHHFRQFAWMLVPAGVLGLARRRLAVAGMLIVGTTALWPMVSALSRGPLPSTVRLQTSRGYVLHVSPEAAAMTRFLDWSVQTAGGPVLFVPNGSGWLYASRQRYVSRHTWFYSRAVVRPFEEHEFARTVSTARTAIECGSAATRPFQALPAETQRAIRDRFVLAARSHGCVVFKARDRASKP